MIFFENNNLKSVSENLETKLVSLNKECDIFIFSESSDFIFLNEAIDVKALFKKLITKVKDLWESFIRWVKGIYTKVKNFFNKKNSDSLELSNSETKEKEDNKSNENKEFIKIKEEIKEAIKIKKATRIRSLLDNNLLWYPKEKKFLVECFNIVKKDYPEVFDEIDERESLIYDKSKWNKQYFYEESGKLLSNYAKERYLLLIDMAFYLSTNKNSEKNSKDNKNNSDFKLPDKYLKAIENKDTLKLQMMLVTILYTEDIERFTNTLNAVKKEYPEVIVPLKGKIQKQNPEDWDEDYLNQSFAELRGNFSQERINHVLKMMKYLNSEEKKKLDESMNLLAESSIQLSKRSLPQSTKKIKETLRLLTNPRNINSEEKVDKIYNSLNNFYKEYKNISGTTSVNPDFKKKNLENVINELKVYSSNLESYYKTINQSLNKGENPNLNIKRVKLLSHAIFIVKEILGNVIADSK